MITLVPSTTLENNYRINWNHQQNHVLEGLKSLLEQDDLLLTDVTLACDGEYIQAHKLVLSLCSPFFKDLFVRNKADKSNTIIILGNVSAINLRYILQFVYQGTVDLPSKDVDNFLLAGKMLQIEGLASTTEQTESSAASHQAVNQKDTNQHRKTRRRSSSGPSQRQPSVSATHEVLPVPPKIARLSEPVIPLVTPVEPHSVVNDEGYEDPLEGLQHYGEEDQEPEDAIGWGNLKSEPIQVYSGHVDVHQAEVIHNQSVQDDSFGGSVDNDSYPVPVSTSGFAMASSSARLQRQPQRSSTNTVRNTPRRVVNITQRSPTRTVQRKSLMWTYFQELDTIPKAARCKLCSVELRMFPTNTTGNLRGHLKCRHKAQFADIERREKDRAGRK